MREIITLQVGRCGNRVGQKVSLEQFFLVFYLQLWCEDSLSNYTAPSFTHFQ